MSAGVARFHPPTKPKILSAGSRSAEHKVWNALARLNSHWDIFYSARDKNRSGYHREVDYVAIWYNRIFYIEVKGGLIDVHTGAGPSVLWNRQTKAGKELPPVDPTRLWDAKKALHDAIRAECGKTPRAFGFTEYEVFVFPDTPRSETQAKGLDDEKVFHFFADDLENLERILAGIVRREKGKFVPRPQIRRIIGSVSALALQADRIMQPAPAAAVHVVEGAAAKRIEVTSSVVQAAVIQQHSVVQQHSAIHRSVASPVIVESWPLEKTQPPRRLDQLFRRMLPWLGLFAIGTTGLAIASLLGPVRQPTAPLPLPNLVRSAQPQPAAPATPALQAVSPKADRSVRKESDLPDFIPVRAKAAVEQVLIQAHERNAVMPWAAGAQHGYVTLVAIEGNGCNRYRITRNDTQPIGLDFVRRCI